MDIARSFAICSSELLTDSRSESIFSLQRINLLKLAFTTEAQTNPLHLHLYQNSKTTTKKTTTFQNRLDISERFTSRYVWDCLRTLLTSNIFYSLCNKQCPGTEGNLNILAAEWSMIQTLRSWGALISQSLPRPVQNGSWKGQGNMWTHNQVEEADCCFCGWQIELSSVDSIQWIRLYRQAANQNIPKTGVTSLERAWR